VEPDPLAKDAKEWVGPCLYFEVGMGWFGAASI
jgi:hypothetical protein